MSDKVNFALVVGFLLFALYQFFKLIKDKGIRHFLGELRTLTGGLLLIAIIFTPSIIISGIVCGDNTMAGGILSTVLGFATLFVFSAIDKTK